jgi:hypothetical protein
MERLWAGLKRFGNFLAIMCLCLWLLVWVVGSWQAGHVLSVDDVIPAADRWPPWWR